jgi:disulfide oxidoreductase YuzD
MYRDHQRTCDSGSPKTWAYLHMMAKTKITFKSKVCEFLIDCLKEKFPNMKFGIEILDNQNENTEEADQKVEDG